MRGLVFMVFINTLVIAKPLQADISGNIVVETDVIDTEINKTAILENKAKKWKLSIAEYQRYISLVDGPIGKLNPNIDPLLALGMFAKTKQEQQRYAELYAQQEFELTERTLRFQRMYREAFNRLYPDTPTIDHTLLSPYFSAQEQKKSIKQIQNTAKRQFIEYDRLLIFVSDQCHRCEEMITQALQLISSAKHTGIDLYLLGAGSDDEVRQWAKKNLTHIHPTDVITLNRDEGLYRRLSAKTVDIINSDIPIFLKRGNRFFKLKNSDLGL